MTGAAGVSLTDAMQTIFSFLLLLDKWPTIVNCFNFVDLKTKLREVSGTYNKFIEFSSQMKSKLSIRWIGWFARNFFFQQFLCVWETSDCVCVWCWRWPLGFHFFALPLSVCKKWRRRKISFFLQKPEFSSVDESIMNHLSIFCQWFRWAAHSQVDVFDYVPLCLANFIFFLGEKLQRNSVFSINAGITRVNLIQIRWLQMHRSLWNGMRRFVKLFVSPSLLPRASQPSDRLGVNLAVFTRPSSTVATTVIKSDRFVIAVMISGNERHPPIIEAVIRRNYSTRTNQRWCRAVISFRTVSTDSVTLNKMTQVTAFSAF